MIRVGVVGYGTIGKRVADAVARQSDMQLVGVAKLNPDYRALLAVRRGVGIYTVEDRIEAFRSMGIEIQGTIEELLERVDVVVDATPKGVGARNRDGLYRRYGSLKAIFQGGEEAKVAELSFNALVNYDEAMGRRYVRVVSCNTTAILRIVAALSIIGGMEIERLRVFIVRRGADPHEYRRGPINDVVLEHPPVPSHHADDVRSVAPKINVFTMAVAVPVTIAHVHFVYVKLRSSVSRSDVVDTLYRTPRIALFATGHGFKSVAQVIEWARDLGRGRGDVPENIVFEDAIAVKGDEVFLAMAVHQESIVVPENIDAIRAVTKAAPKWSSIKRTDLSLGLVTEGKSYG